MLQELEIKDFALIEQVQISWTRGFNVLTGETGAGKSIIIDALNAVLGGKAGANVIRNGATKATIEATFQQTPAIAGWLKQQELQNEDGDTLILSREISKTGSKIRINGTLTNSGLVQELRQQLLTIHAQHEARSLSSSQSQLEMLDGLGDVQHKKLQDKVRTLHAKAKELAGQLKDLQISEDERIRRLDFAKFQLKELEDAALIDADEFEAVSAQTKVLSNVVQLESSSLKAQELLNGVGESACAIDILQDSLLELERACELDNNLSPTLESLRNGLGILEDSVRELRRYRETLDSDPQTLAHFESRLNLLAGIRRKYGPTLQEAINRQSELQTEVEKLETAQATAGEVTRELEAAQKNLTATCSDLSSKRKQLALKLSATIHAELVELGMERCRFEIAFEETEPAGSGIDRIEFMIAPNPGQPLLPVAKIASGGELSRVMLAIKSTVAEADSVSTVVFDEIDTGLSGKVLQSMRDKLAALARSHQILCITHQPIIASVADNHLQIVKDQTADATHISVACLEAAERIKCLAAMASGQDEQKEALKFADTLYQEGLKLRAL